LALVLALGGLCSTQAAWGQLGTGQSDPIDDATERDLLRGEADAGERRLPALSRDLVNGTVPLAGPVDPKVYRVGPGDILQLNLWGAVTRVVPLTVGPEGTIVLPGAGTLAVDGRTLESVRAEVFATLRPRFRGVGMDLRLAAVRSFRVSTTGLVKQPGSVVASGASRVSDVIAEDHLIEGASRRRIEVRHRDGSVEIADLDLLWSAGDASHNPWVRDGDVIHVPSATEFLHVQGAVPRPGRYELGARDSIRTLLRLAGDPLPSALVERVMLVRFPTPLRPESSWVSLASVYGGAGNLPVEDGSRLYVYFIPKYKQQDEALILGEVKRPGGYPIVEGVTRLSELVRAAEGFLPEADLSAIRVHRRNPVTTEQDPELERLLRLSRNELTASEYELLRTKLAAQREDYRVDWDRVRQSSSLDLLLRDGDAVRVERLVSSIRVDGEVRRPGIVNYAPARDVEYYVREAGGFTDRAWRGKVRVTRSLTGQSLLARNVATLDPGDLVWVPEKPDRTVWEQSRDLLTVLGSVATIVIAIRSVR
jgi:protein involved in polysaccharide export with SLBB domain